MDNIFEFLRWCIDEHIIFSFLVFLILCMCGEGICNNLYRCIMFVVAVKNGVNSDKAREEVLRVAKSNIFSKKE